MNVCNSLCEVRSIRPPDERMILNLNTLMDYKPNEVDMNMAPGSVL